MSCRWTTCALLTGTLLLGAGCNPRSLTRTDAAGKLCDDDEVCPADMVCVNQRCSFGTRQDSGQLDVDRADSLIADSGGGGGMDSRAADSAQPDGARPDSVRVDSARSDTFRPDSSSPDRRAPDTAAPAEICNGRDDDDDGLRDEDFDCVQNVTDICTASCGTTGSQTCSSSCEPGPCVPPSEACNGSDDNCDGTPDNRSGCRVAVYRYLCNSDHVFGNGAATPGGCVGENNGNPVWYNYASPVAGSAFTTRPLVRLFNASVPDHLLTTSSTQIDAAVALGYVLEGNIGHCSPTAVAGSTTPLYRLYNSGNGDHLYTTGANERDYLISTGAYVDESITCHVWPEP